MIETVPFAINMNFRDVLAAAGARLLLLQPHGPAGCLAKIQHDLRVGSILVSQADWDGVEWLHASISYPLMPTYDDLTLLHHAVFGRHRWSYQVFAPLTDHVDIHPTALHLWGRADGHPATPNFGEWGTI